MHIHSTYRGKGVWSPTTHRPMRPFFWGGFLGIYICQPSDVSTLRGHIRRFVDTVMTLYICQPSDNICVIGGFGNPQTRPERPLFCVNPLSLGNMPNSLGFMNKQATRRKALITFIVPFTLVLIINIFNVKLPLWVYLEHFALE